MRDYDLVSENGEDRLKAVPGSDSASCAKGGDPVSASFAALPPEAALCQKPSFHHHRANSRATVPPRYRDYVGVEALRRQGQVTGERRFIGLYTSTAYSASPWDIPLLRRKVGRHEACRLPARPHGKTLMAILEAYPRDELFPDHRSLSTMSWASCTWASARESGCSCAAISTGGSCPA